MVSFGGITMAGQAFIGFGEAGTAFVTNWAKEDLAQTKGFDLKSLDPSNAMSDRFTKFGVAECQSADEAIADVGMIFSLVTADQAQLAAASCARLNQGTLFLDCNSISPGTKRANAELIENNGGRYVDVAVLAPVHPALNKVPLLVSGPHAAEATERLNALGMNATFADGPVGHASSIKMIRSIAVKGIEAMLAETTTAAVAEGVEDVVLDSLDKMFPGFDFRARAAYHLERMMAHGQRRGAEMDEVAKTVQELGLPNHVSAGAAKWHYAIGDLGLTADSNDYRNLVSAVLDRLKED